MSRSKLIVANIGDALDRADDYKGAVSWRIAPLNSLSGARSWQVPSRDGRRWVKLDDPDSAAPCLTADPDHLPAVPHSRQRLLAFAFIDETGSTIKPEIIVGTGDQSASDSDGPRHSSRTETIAVFNSSIKQANDDARAAQRLANSTLSEVAIHYKDLLELRRLEYVRVSGELAKANEELGKLREENTALLVSMAELCNRSDFAETIRQLFGQRPELLVGSLKDLVGGLGRLLGSDRPGRLLSKSPTGDQSNAIDSADK